MKHRGQGSKIGFVARAFAALGVTAVALALTAAAAGAAIVFPGSSLKYQAQDGESNSVVVSYDAEASEYLFQETGSTSPTTGVTTNFAAPCHQVDLFPGKAIACPAAKVKTIRVIVADGDDTVLFDPMAPSPAKGVLLSGGTGNDRLQGADGPSYHGARGDTIKGGPGNDSLIGLGGPDRLSGSSGNDRIDARSTNDQTAEKVSCGSGTDKFVGDEPSATREWQDRGSSCESLWDVSVDPF